MKVHYEVTMSRKSCIHPTVHGVFIILLTPQTSPHYPCRHVNLLETKETKIHVVTFGISHNSVSHRIIQGCYCQPQIELSLGPI